MIYKVTFPLKGGSKPKKISNGSYSSEILSFFN